MNDERVHGLVCHGVQVGDTIAPPFSLGQGEMAKLVFATGREREMDHVLSAMLANRDGQIETHGCMTTVESPITRSPLREMFHRQTAAEWLMARCGMSRQEAEVGLNRVGVKPDSPIGFLAGNPRWKVGFVAAMHRRPTALVFTTIGCDPMGMKSALEIVAAQQGTTACVYFTCFPDVKIPEPEYAAVIDVAAGKREAVA